MTHLNSVIIDVLPSLRCLRAGFNEVRRNHARELGGRVKGIDTTSSASTRVDSRYVYSTCTQIQRLADQFRSVMCNPNEGCNPTASVALTMPSAVSRPDRRSGSPFHHGFRFFKTFTTVFLLRYLPSKKTLPAGILPIDPRGSTWRNSGTREE